MSTARNRITPAILLLVLAAVQVFSVSAQAVPPPTIATQDRPARASIIRSQDPRSAETIASLVDSLGDDSFHARQVAARSLVVLANHAAPNSNARDGVVAGLYGGLQHPMFEVRTASMRLLQSIGQVEFDRQIDRLLNPHVDPDSIDMAGWRRFSKLAGHDSAARSLFARMATRYPGLIRDLEDVLCGQVSIENWRSRHQRSLERLDACRLDGDDAAAWAILLSSDTVGSHFDSGNVPMRIAMALGKSAMGPRVKDRNDATVIRRLIDHWIDVHQAKVTVRASLLIAMRYGCRRRANELCDRVFADSDALASSQSTAMLCASVLGRPDLESLLSARLQDDRTAHVWQLIASRPKRIRTQVGDVALALLLHHCGIDPREAGFDELRADQFVVYRDHSLGFVDDPARDSARRRAAELMRERSEAR